MINYRFESDWPTAMFSNPVCRGMSRDGLAHVITSMPEPPEPEPDLIWIDPKVWDRLEATLLARHHLKDDVKKMWGAGT